MKLFITVFGQDLQYKSAMLYLILKAESKKFAQLVARAVFTTQTHTNHKGYKIRYTNFTSTLFSWIELLEKALF